MKFKKGLTALLLTFTMVFTTGCDNAFYVDFTKFLINDTTEEEVEVELTGLNLKEEIIGEEEISKINDTINELFTVLADRDYYYNNFNNLETYFAEVEDLLSDEYLNKVLSGEHKSSIKKAIDNIYYNEYTHFKSANLISVENTLDKIICQVEIVSINDDILFNSETISLELDYNFSVLSDSTVIDMSSVSNTIKPLGKDSLLQVNHDKFIVALNKLFSSLTNEKLYNEIELNESQESKFNLDTIINNIDIKNKSNDSLVQLFMAGKGKFANYAVDSYKIDDYDGMATTTYVIKFSVKGEVEKYAFEYSRILSDIVKVTKL